MIGKKTSQDHCATKGGNDLQADALRWARFAHGGKNLKKRVGKSDKDSYLQNCLQTEDMRQITTCNLHRILQVAQVAVDQTPPIPPMGMGGRGGG